MLIRPVEASDRADVVRLSVRLAVGVAAWRDPGGVASATHRWVVSAVDHHDADRCPVFVAEDSDGSVLGFVSVGSRPHWSGETDAYVGELVVAETAARKGVGGALMQAAEDWGWTQGYKRLSLETGAANQVARAFYRSRGYQDEDIRLSVSLADVRP